MRIPVDKHKQNISDSDLKDLINEAKKVKPKKVVLLQKIMEKKGEPENKSGYELKDIYRLEDTLDVEKLEKLSESGDKYARFLLGHYHYTLSLCSSSLHKYQNEIGMARNLWMQSHKPSLLSIAFDSLATPNSQDLIFLRTLKDDPKNPLGHLGVTFLKREKGYMSSLPKKMNDLRDDEAVIWYYTVGHMLKYLNDPRIKIYDQLTKEYEDKYGKPKVIIELSTFFAKRMELEEKSTPMDKKEKEDECIFADQVDDILDDINTGNLDEVVAVDKQTLEKISLWLLKNEDMRKTLLHAAISSTTPIPFIKFFLENTTLKINDVDAYGQTILHYAAMERDFELIEFLLSIDNINVCVIDLVDGRIPLHFLFKCNLLDDLTAQETTVLKLFIDKTEATQVPIKKISKPLGRKSEEAKSSKRKKKLTVSGLEVTDVINNTSYDLMITSAPLEIIKHYFDKKAKAATLPIAKRSLLSVIEKQGLNLLRYIVETFKVNLADVQPNDDRLLCNAILFRKVDIVRYLLEQGVNVNEQDNGSSALHIAVETGDLNIIEILVYAPGIQLYLRNKEGKTALRAAKELGYTEAKILIEDARARQRAQETSYSTDQIKAKAKKIPKIQLTPASEPITIDDLNSLISVINDNDVKEVSAYRIKQLQCSSEIDKEFSKLHSNENRELMRAVSQLRQKIVDWKIKQSTEFSRDVKFREKMIFEYSKKIEAEDISQNQLKKIHKKFMALKKSRIFIIYMEKLRRTHLDLLEEIKTQKRLQDQAAKQDPVANSLRLLRGNITNSKLDLCMDDYRNDGMDAIPVRSQPIASLPPEVISQIQNALKRGFSQKGRINKSGNPCQQYLLKVMLYNPLFNLCFPEITKLLERLKLKGLHTIMHNWLVESCKNYQMTRAAFAALVIIRQWRDWEEWCNKEKTDDKDILPKGWEIALLNSTTAKVFGITKADITNKVFILSLNVPIITLKSRLNQKNKNTPVGTPLPTRSTHDEIKSDRIEQKSVQKDIIQRDYWQAFKRKENPRALETTPSNKSESVEIDKTSAQPIIGQKLGFPGTTNKQSDLKTQESNLKIEQRPQHEQQSIDLKSSSLVKLTTLDALIASLTAENLDEKLKELFDLLPELKKSFNDVNEYLHAEDKQFMLQWIKKRIMEVEKANITAIKRILLVIVSYGKLVTLPNIRELTQAEQFDKLTDILCEEIFLTETAKQLQVSDTPEFDLFVDYQNINNFLIQWQANKQDDSAQLKSILKVPHTPISTKELDSSNGEQKEAQGNEEEKEKEKGEKKDEKKEDQAAAEQKKRQEKLLEMVKKQKEMIEEAARRLQSAKTSSPVPPIATIPFREFESDILEALGTIEGANPFMVGGSVLSRLIQILNGAPFDKVIIDPDKDVDIFVIASTDQIMKALAPWGVKQSPKVDNLFYITVPDPLNPPNMIKVEIWRSDHESLIQDLLKRDFTINTFIAKAGKSSSNKEDKENKIDKEVKITKGQVYDLLDAFEDLKAKRIKTTIEADESFSHDPFRILRGEDLKRQYPGFDFTPDNQIAALNHSSKIPQMDLTARIHSWLAKLLYEINPGKFQNNLQFIKVNISKLFEKALANKILAEWKWVEEQLSAPYNRSLDAAYAIFLATFNSEQLLRMEEKEDIFSKNKHLRDILKNDHDNNYGQFWEKFHQFKHPFGVPSQPLTIQSSSLGSMPSISSNESSSSGSSPKSKSSSTKMGLFPARGESASIPDKAQAPTESIAAKVS